MYASNVTPLCEASGQLSPLRSRDCEMPTAEPPRDPEAKRKSSISTGFYTLGGRKQKSRITKGDKSRMLKARC